MEAVGLLQQAGRAVAALDDAYNAAYNASAAADGWGGQGHDVAELGEVSEAEEPPDAAGFWFGSSSGRRTEREQRLLHAFVRGISLYPRPRGTCLVFWLRRFPISVLPCIYRISFAGWMLRSACHVTSCCVTSRRYPKV